MYIFIIYVHFQMLLLIKQLYDSIIQLHWNIGKTSVSFTFFHKIENYYLWVRIFNYILIPYEAVVWQSVYFVTNSSDENFTRGIIIYILEKKRVVVKVGTQRQLACIQCSKKQTQTNISSCQVPLLQDYSKSEVTVKC